MILGGAVLVEEEEEEEEGLAASGDSANLTVNPRLVFLIRSPLDAVRS